MTEITVQPDPPATTGPPPLAIRAELEGQFEACELVRPFHRACYEPGDRLEYTLTGVVPANPGRAVLEIERFVGGGFAGQVYRVRLVELQCEGEPIAGLAVGQVYAIKILKPPSGFSCLFRDFLYFLAYQGKFSAQVNPAAVRVGVLWQKLIRRAAAVRYGADDAVCDTYATFHDPQMHSFGEINEWIDGRVWKFEVDDALFDRWKFDGEPPADHNCPEYVSKKRFMGELVELLHDMGAGELARQYEWWTCKSQPNALKRLDAEDAPRAGLTAVDFRAGLALLPVLPMSPADFGLILRGLVRGRLVQFDRRDPVRFGRFMERHKDAFADLQPAIDELELQDAAHRGSLPDITHHHVRVLTDGKLRRSVKEGAITAWENLGRVDAPRAERLRRGHVLFPLLFLVSMVPLLGRVVVRVWGDAVTRSHLKRCLTSFGYLWRAMRGARIEALVVWHRKGRVDDERALRLVRRPVRFWLQRIFFGWMPPTWHRAFTDRKYAWGRLREAVGFALSFLRVPEFREAWLLDQIRLGREEGMLTDDEAARITEQVKDPYIQKYLRCLAVHVCTVPVTQIVMVLVGAAVVAYGLFYREMSWVESMAWGTGAAAAIQFMPISPGSITRGVFVLYLMIRERDIRNYYIAAPVSFLHVIGYLAFPLQMVAHDPALARFMAGRWAKNVVHVVPVFGESGGLLEHFIFDLFFNLPLSIKRAFKARPIRWAIGTAIGAAMVACVAVAGVARVWEWRQPQTRLEAAEVVSVVSYDDPDGGLVHWSWDGVRVHFAGHEQPVDFPADRWDESVAVGDRVDAMIRPSFFGDEYDGLAVGDEAVAEWVAATQPAE